MRCMFQTLKEKFYEISIQVVNPEYRTRQAGFLRVFLVLTGTGMLASVAIEFIKATSAPEAPHLSRLVITLGLVALMPVLYILNRKGHTTLSGYIFIFVWILAVTLLYEPDQPNFALILYLLPTAGASFTLAPISSIISATLSIAAYCLAYFSRPAVTPFNYLLVLCVYIFAIGGWVISVRFNNTLARVRLSEKRYQDLLENSPSVNYVITGEKKGRISYTNPKIQALLGFTAQDWLSESNLWEKQVYQEDQAWVAVEWERSKKERLPFHAEYRMKTKSGKIIWVSDDAIAIRSAGEPVQVHGILMDITQRKRVEAVQSVLYSISQAANSAQDLQTLFQQIHQALGTLMHAENFFIALYDPDSDMIQFPYFVDQYDSPPPPHVARGGLTEYVLRTGKPLFAFPEKFEELVKKGGVSSIGSPSVDWMGVPLKVGEQTIGVMAVQSYTKGIRFTLEDLEILTFVSTQAAMVIERKRAEEKLRISEHLYRTTIDSLDEMIHVVDRDHRIIMVNQGFRQRYMNLGLAIDKLEKTLEQTFAYLDNGILEQYDRIFSSGEKYETIATQTFQDMHFIYNIDIVPVKEGDRVARAITVLRDITSEKEAEEQIKAALREKEVLLREIHHRVKNNLQVMSSLLSLQADYIQDAHTLALFRETQSRLRSMALIHEELYQSHNLSEINYNDYIEKLTANLFQAFSANPNIQLQLELAPVRFGIDTAIPCGLIINELVTNALKYAFPKQRSGTILVELISEKIAGDQPVFTLKILDNGIGLPESVDIENTETLGLQLVNILVNQLKGTLCLNRQGGTGFTIRFSERQGAKA